MRKLTALLLLATTLLLPAGCQGIPPLPVENPPEELIATDTPPEETAEIEKIFRWIASGEDSTINPHDSAAVPNYEIVDLIQVSLYDWAPAETRDKAILIPCLALEEPATEDGYTWTIQVNPDAKWANGEAITAETFLYSWQMGLDPKLAYTGTSSIASQYITVVNGVEYYSQPADGTGEISWEDVGFKALDPYTLEITTTQRYTAAQVMRHFAFRTTSPVYPPLYEAGMNADRTSTTYGSSLAQFMSCGPFTLKTWIKGSQREFERNPLFINAHMVHLDGITCRVVADEANRLLLFEQGESDYVALGTAGLVKYADDPAAFSYDQKTIRTIEINRNNPDNAILQSVDFRAALYYAIDRNAVARLTNSTPAPYFLSTLGVSFSDGSTYRQMEAANDWLPSNGGYDPEHAVTLFESALAAHNIDSVSLTLVYNESLDSLRAASEYLQGQLTEIFGTDRFSLSLKAMPHTAALDLMRTSVGAESRDWDLCWSGWGLAAETFEPHKKFAPYLSTASNRYTDYGNDFLDENYPLLLTEEYRMDEQATFELTIALEQSLVLEDVTCIPVFQDKSYVLFSPRIALAVDHYVGSLAFGWEYADILS